MSVSVHLLLLKRGPMLVLQVLVYLVLTASSRAALWAFGFVATLILVFRELDSQGGGYVLFVDGGMVGLG